MQNGTSAKTAIAIEAEHGGQQPATVAIAGLGAIGLKVARALDAGLPGLTLVAVASRDHQRARAQIEDFQTPVMVVSPGRLADIADIVVECAPANVFRSVADPTIEAGKKLVTISVGALLDHPELISNARRTGGQIIVPTGALLGLDAVTAAAEGEIFAVRMISRKPVAGLLGAPHLTSNFIDIENIKTPVLLFDGTAREAVKGFPANLNVAAALSLAGIGAEKTRLEVWADPNIDRNIHEIVVEADSARITLKIENIPSENPKTGKITALSIIALLRKLNSPVRVGT